MVFSVFAGTVAFSGSAAAAATNLDLGNGDGTNAIVNQGNSLSNVEADIGTGTPANDLHVWIDTDDDGVYDSTEPAVSNTGSSGTTDQTFSDLSTSGVETGQYDVAAAEVPNGNGLVAGVTSENITNTLVVAEPDDPSLQSAVHYDDGTNGPTFEIVFSEPVDTAAGDVEVFDDDATVATSGSNTNVTRLTFTTSNVLTGDLVVGLSSNIVDAQGNPISDDGNNSITLASTTIQTGDDKNVYQGGVAAIQNDTALSAPIEIEGEDNDYFFQGSTGENSKVYVFNTSNRDTGAYNVSLNGSNIDQTQVTNRNLGFTAPVDDLNVTDDDTIEVDVSANAGNREVRVELLDNSGDDIATKERSTGGNGEVTVEFDTATVDGGEALDTGDYTVESTDLFSGISTESSTITVTQAADASASFASNSIIQERGDILETTVELTETDEATISFGSQDTGVLANATVEDDDGDDQVTVQINTYNFLNGQNIYALPDGSDDIINDRQSNGAGGSPFSQLSGLIDSGNYDLEVEADAPAGGADTGVTDSDDVATVTLEERSVENLRTWTGSSDEIGSVGDLEDVNEALTEGQITQSSEVAVGDFAVLQLQASGFEGRLDARQNEDVSSQFDSFDDTGAINLTIEESDPGANQGASELNLTYVGSEANVSVIADGQNDTYFIVVDTGEVNFKSPRSEPVPSNEDIGLEANFTVVNNDSPRGQDFINEDNFDSDENSETIVEFNANEPDVEVSEPFNVSQASAQTVSGTTNIAPGTELSLRVRSQDGVSPSFLKTADPVVQPDGTFSATFDFSQQNVGDEYDIIVQDPIRSEDTEEEGQVVGAVATDTATPEPDTDTATPEPDTATPEPDTATPEPDTATPEPDTDTPTSTPTSTPGFGVVVALTALLAAALLAVRRD
jgi:PGF-CTERM protein